MKSIEWNISDKVQMAENTTGTTTSTTYTLDNPLYQAEKGWECPRCGRINAPWVRQCDCSRDSWTYRPDWFKEITCNPDTFKVHPETTIWKVPSSICQSDSITTAKSDPNSTVYTTAKSPIVGGSDYWDEVNKTWTNVPYSLNNLQKELNEIKSTFSNTLRGE